MYRSQHVSVLISAIFALLFVPVPWTARATETIPFEVTVHYTGPGEVDARHGLVVIVLDQADFMDPTTRILGMRYLTTNGASVRFADLANEEVFVFAMYDEEGGYTGTGGPPGPIGFIRGADGVPAPVSVGVRPRVTLTFDDALRRSTDRFRSGPSADKLAATEGGIVEIRMYQVKPGQRDRFIELFEENLGHQLEHGLRVVGQFRSLDDENTFVWIRAFESQEERLRLSRIHYFSPHWLNSRRLDVAELLISTEVLLVEPTALSLIR